VEAIPFLHAAHDVREAISGLRLVSWGVIGLGFGALVLSWGWILSWFRAPDKDGPRLIRWGRDNEGLYFEVRDAGDQAWSVETPGGPLDLTGTRRGPRTFFRAKAADDVAPGALVSSEGLRLEL